MDSLLPGIGFFKDYILHLKKTNLYFNNIFNHVE